MNTRLVRIMLLSGFLLISVIVVANTILTQIKHQVDVDAIIVRNVAVYETGVTFIVDLVASGERLTSVKYDVAQEKMFIQVYSSYLGLFYRGGGTKKFSISTSTKNVKQINIVDKSNNKKIIWEKNE